MTYHNKLLLRRVLIVLAIVAAVISLVLLIGFTYLGRYVVYTEDGAYFSFQAPSPSQTASEGYAAGPSSIELVTGEPISTNEALGVDRIQLKDTEVKGFLVDYNTLSAGNGLDEIELSADENNTLVLEMRAADSTILSNQSVLELIQRANTQETWLVAVLSCLADSEYAQAHRDQAIRMDGGALWMEHESYWLDPANNEVSAHISEQIQQLADMGFDEVILNDFYIPDSDGVDYSYGNSTGEEIMTAAFNDLLDASMDFCRLSLLITDPVSGHPAMDAADRIYVLYQDGGTVKQYAERHKDQYLVFITDSHDTRFDSYGMVETELELNVGSIAPEDSDNSGESDETGEAGEESPEDTGEEDTSPEDTGDGDEDE